MAENGYNRKSDRQMDWLQRQLKEKDRELQRLTQLLIEAKKQFEELEKENSESKLYKSVVENGSTEEQQLRKQLEEAQERIQELEEKQVYPAAMKKDSNGNPITNEIIVELFESGMNPNQISKYLGNMTHQGIRARLKKLVLYCNK
ncbi:hypothetical protein JCM17380_13220 [Desulfosporosinus burensis]